MSLVLASNLDPDIPAIFQDIIEGLLVAHSTMCSNTQILDINYVSQQSLYVVVKHGNKVFSYVGVNVLMEP